MYRQAYTSRLRTAAQRAQRAQHLAQLQIFQLTQERRRLQEELSRLRGERETMAERCATFQRQQSELTPRIEETEWEVRLCGSWQWTIDNLSPYSSFPWT